MTRALLFSRRRGVIERDATMFTENKRKTCEKNLFSCHNRAVSRAPKPRVPRRFAKNKPLLPKNAIVDEKPPRADPGAPDNTNRWDARYQSTKA